MACYHPMPAHRDCATGVVRMLKKGMVGELLLPCGQCVGCRLERSRQWAVRLMHEASLHEDNCFITLTYRPECLPEDGSLVKKHFQDFMKRLRSRFFSSRIRYFHCGEYGENLGRPHYHACLFGLDLPDRVFYKMAGDSRLYTSELLQDVWGLGFCTVGDVTFESAAYVARYVMKKVTGDDAEEHYLSVDRSTGVIRQNLDGSLVVMQPEYVTMSRGGRTGRGLAYDWFRKFGNEVYPSDDVIVRGARCRPPRYYDGLYEVADSVGYAVLKENRLVRALKHTADNTPGRLKAREVCANARVALLKRGGVGES